MREDKAGEKQKARGRGVDDIIEEMKWLDIKEGGKGE